MTEWGCTYWESAAVFGISPGRPNEPLRLEQPHVLQLHCCSHLHAQSTLPLPTHGRINWEHWIHIQALLKIKPTAMKLRAGFLPGDGGRAAAMGIWVGLPRRPSWLQLLQAAAANELRGVFWHPRYPPNLLQRHGRRDQSIGDGCGWSQRGAQFSGRNM